MAGTGLRGAVPERGAAPRGCLAGPARGAAPEAPHAMSPPERGPVEGSSSSLGVPPPPHARSLTMLDSTLRHCHGNRSFRLCWRCLHQRPQQGRIQPENASPTQASSPPGRDEPQPGGGTGVWPSPAVLQPGSHRGDSAPVPAPRAGRAAVQLCGLRAWAAGSDGQRRAATGSCSPAARLEAPGEAASGTGGGTSTDSRASAFPTTPAFVP